MVGQPHRNFMKMASWSSVSEHLVNPIGMSDQLKWNNQKSKEEDCPAFSLQGSTVSTPIRFAATTGIKLAAA